MQLAKCQYSPDVGGASVSWRGERTSTFVSYVVCPHTPEKMWAPNVLPSFPHTIRPGCLGHELRREMESCFRNSAEENNVYVVTDYWISLDCSFKTAKLVTHAYLTAWR